MGMIVLVGPRTAALRKSLECFKQRQSFREKRQELASAQANGTSFLTTKLEEMPLISVSTISSDATVVRFMLPDIQYGYELVMEILRPIASELGGLVPYADRIHHHIASKEEIEQQTWSSSSSLSSHHPVMGNAHPIELLKSYRSATVSL